MATGAKMSYNHFQSGKYGTLPQQASRDMEITQDMHLKMSKKIAQLTKVIYALNTKNDEHEAIVTSIKEQHEEQIVQMLSETRTKMDQIQGRLGNDEGQKRRLEKLEVMLEDSQRHKRTALAEFEEYKQMQEERDMALRTKHSQKVLALSHEVLTVKKEFQARLQILDVLRNKLETGQDQTLDQLKAEHIEELRLLTESLMSTSEMSDEQQRQYVEQIVKLTDTCNTLTADKKKLNEEFDCKMAKSQAYFERELQILKESQNLSETDHLDRFKVEREKLRKDFVLEKSVLTKRADDLLAELSQKEQDVEIYKDRVLQMEDDLENSNNNVVQLTKQIADAKQETTKVLQKLENLELQLKTSTEWCEQQAKQLIKKSKQLEEVEKCKLQHEEKIQELEGKLLKAEDRIKLLETMKRTMETQSSEQSKQQGDELNEMEKALEDLSQEKQEIREEYEKRLIAEAKEHAAREKELEESHLAAVDALKKAHEADGENMRKDLQDKLRRMKEELAVQLDAEMSRVLCEKKKQEEDYLENRRVLLDRLAQAETKVSGLVSQVKDSKEELESATAKLGRLREKQEKLKTELEETKDELKTTKKEMSTLQTEYKTLKVKHKEKVTELEADTKSKLEQLQLELDRKWKTTLSAESVKMTEQMKAQYEQEKAALIDKLTNFKEAELNSQHFASQKLISELNKKLEALHGNNDELTQAWTQKFEDLKAVTYAENKKLRDDLLSEAEEYAKKIDVMKIMYTKRISKMEELQAKDTQKLEEDLKAQNLSDMKTQMTAHRATVAALKNSGEQKLGAELAALKTQQEAFIDSLRSELSAMHREDAETSNRRHTDQLATARMELERAIDINKQKAAEYEMKVTELKDDIRFREHTISSIENEMQELQSGISNMAQELEMKESEILKGRSDANRQLKATQEKHSEQHQELLNRLSAEYVSEKNHMLKEFMEAQQLLKDKISALQMMLEAAEDQYRNREPRDEDIKMIQTLQATIYEGEQQLRKLTEEKKKYQMELINRETNFNKMFNASPSVGVLNPLGGTKSKGKKPDKPQSKYSSGSNTSLASHGSRSDRLSPLPNSPLHKERLNHTRPLPPTSKFIK